MQTSRPSSLKAIPLEIDRLNKAQFELYQCQEEYRKNLFFHPPKALETELNDIKDHFSSLSTNYVELLAQETFLQCILQEPSVESTEFDKTLAEERTFMRELDDYIQHVHGLGQQITISTQLIEQTISKTLKTAEEATGILDQLTLVEEEIADIDRIVSKQSHRTIKEVKFLLERQTKDMSKLTKTMLNKKDSIAEQKWHVQDLEKEVGRLESTKDKIKAEADGAVYINSRRDERVEKSYREYVKKTEWGHCLFGVDKMEFQGDSLVTVFLKNTILRVEINAAKKQISNVEITGTTTVSIDDLISEAKQQTTANEGIRIITLTVLARLKKI